MYCCETCQPLQLDAVAGTRVQLPPGRTAAMRAARAAQTFVSHCAPDDAADVAAKSVTAVAAVVGAASQAVGGAVAGVTEGAASGVGRTRRGTRGAKGQPGQLDGVHTPTPTPTSRVAPGSSGSSGARKKARTTAGCGTTASILVSQTAAAAAAAAAAATAAVAAAVAPGEPVTHAAALSQLTEAEVRGMKVTQLKVRGRMVSLLICDFPVAAICWLFTSAAPCMYERLRHVHVLTLLGCVAHVLGPSHRHHVMAVGA